MQLNMNDPDSIVNWWRVYPERHWAYIEFFASHALPEFRMAIHEAQQRIQVDPCFVERRGRQLQRSVDGAPLRCRPGEDAQDCPSDAVAPDLALPDGAAWH